MGNRSGGRGAFGNCCACSTQTGRKYLGAVKDKPAPCVKLADAEDDAPFRTRVIDVQARGLTRLSNNYGKRAYRRGHRQSYHPCSHGITPPLHVGQKVLYLVRNKQVSRQRKEINGLIAVPTAKASKL